MHGFKKEVILSNTETLFSQVCLIQVTSSSSYSAHVFILLDCKQVYATWYTRETLYIRLFKSS